MTSKYDEQVNELRAIDKELVELDSEIEVIFNQIIISIDFFLTAGTLDKIHQLIYCTVAFLNVNTQCKQRETTGKIS